MKNNDFFSYAFALYRRRYEAEEIAYHTWYNANRALSAFKAYCELFLSSKDLAFEKIDVQLVQRYRQHCLYAKGNSQVTVSRKLTPVFFVLKSANMEGLANLPSSQFQQSVLCQVTPHRYGSEADRLQRNEGGKIIRHLDDKQLKSLLLYYRSLPEGPMRDSLDYFFFSFHACGLRVSDIVTLEWRQVNMAAARLQKVMVKSKSCLTIPLSEAALQILRRWKLRRPEGRFVFGLLSDNFNLEADANLSRAIDNCNRSIGRRLKTAGEQIGLTFPLGMHVARHSFAVKALNSAQLNVHIISHLLGHSSVVVTEKVYARFLMPTLSKEVEEKLTFWEYSTE